MSESSDISRDRVVYLLGAGATQACVDAVNCQRGTLMSHLNSDLIGRLRHLSTSDMYRKDPSIQRLVNNVIQMETDFEQVITFLDQAPSHLHQSLATDLRHIFEEVLRGRFSDIRQERNDTTPNELYYQLLDMHFLEGLSEELNGCITLNYDNYLELAIAQCPTLQCDLGIPSSTVPTDCQSIRVVKLHGSFGWADVWPIAEAEDGTLWIPPGIQKEKSRYPFNLLWGFARELLDCDVLRIIGCDLGPNDWDLISLLFTTRHANNARPPYRVEVIDAPHTARRIQNMFPYLEVQSLLDIEPIGSRMVSEYGGGPVERFQNLTQTRQQELIDLLGWGENWFHIWLIQRAETLHLDLGSLDTPHRAFQKLLGNAEE